jgi:hypothetical protein
MLEGREVPARPLTPMHAAYEREAWWRQDGGRMAAGRRQAEGRLEGRLRKAGGRIKAGLGGNIEDEGSREADLEEGWKCKWRADENPIQINVWFPIIFPEMKLCSLVISKTWMRKDGGRQKPARKQREAGKKWAGGRHDGGLKAGRSHAWERLKACRRRQAGNRKKGSRQKQ